MPRGQVPRFAGRFRIVITTASVLGLTLVTGGGCGWLAGDLGEVTGAREVHLAALPTPGMRAAYHLQTGATLSGPGVRLLTEAQKSASTVQRYIVAVTAVDPDAFDVRITGSSLPGVVVGRFSRDWSVLRFGVENEGKFTEADLPSFPILGEAFQVSRDVSGRWTVGGNVRIEVIGDAELCERIVATLQAKYDADYGLLMYTYPVNLRN